MFSYFNDKLPITFNDYFTKIERYNTWTASNIHIDYQRTNYDKFSCQIQRSATIEHSTRKSEK